LCSLSHWFDDEDEQFVFNGSNKWFEDAFQAGMKECEDMWRGYLHAVQRQLDKAVKSLGTAVNKECRESLDEAVKSLGTAGEQVFGC
jgi:hypothetical protein